MAWKLRRPIRHQTFTECHTSCHLHTTDYCPTHESQGTRRAGKDGVDGGYIKSGATDSVVCRDGGRTKEEWKAANLCRSETFE